MPVVTAIGKWQYNVFIFFAVLVIACNNKTPAIDDMVWQNLDSAKGISFYIADKGKGNTGDVSLKYTGYFNGGKFIADTADKDEFMLNVLINPLVMNNAAIKKMHKGASGFIKITVADFFLQAFKEVAQYTLNFPPDNKEDFKKDSLQLAALNRFEKIEISSAEKAMAKFEKDNDTTWRQFLKTNPLPESIDLTLKAAFLTRPDFDSVKNLLLQLFPDAELRSSFDSGLYSSRGKTGEAIVYKFIVF